MRRRSRVRCLLAACAAVFTAAAQAATAQATAAQERPSLQGRVALVTGSTSGLGRVLAYQLAELGAEVIVHGRDVERGREVVDSIRRSGGAARFYEADLGSREEVRELADRIARDLPRLDLFISNAGVGPAPDERLLSADGLELRFHVNYLAGFQLTHLLLPLMSESAKERGTGGTMESAPAKIIMVASRTQSPIDFDDVMLEDGFSGRRAYGQSKLAQIMFTFDLAPDLEGTGVTINAVHPAPVMDTRMMEVAGARPQTTPEEGARSVMNVVLSDRGWNGRYFHEMEPGTALPQAYEDEARARLRRLSVEWTGVGGD